MSSHTLEPTPEALGGRSAGAIIKRFLLATRPKFFTASGLPVVVGLAWGISTGGQFDSLVVALAVIATVLVHAASNVYNDVGDDINGSDANNEGRIHPFTGGSRFIQNGVMSRVEMARLSGALFALAVAAGSMLLLLKGITVLWLGLAGIGLGVAYSMPRVQLIAHGLGELAVVVAFGVLPVSGAAWLVSGAVDPTILSVSLAVGLWVAAILQINEVPDIAADEAAGKRTLAVRLGVRGVAKLYAVMQGAAFAILAGTAFAGQLSFGVIVLPAILLAVAMRAAAGIASRDAERLVAAIKTTLAVQLLGCVWLVGWFVLMV